MIAEEYSFYDIADYLYDTNDLLIVGSQTTEERSSFFIKEWSQKGKDIMQLILEDYENEISYNFYKGTKLLTTGNLTSYYNLPTLLHSAQIHDKNILLDLSSLNHIVIMFLTKVLLTQVIPNSLFAAYIRPLKYNNDSENVGFSLCNKISGVNSVPGFTKRESKKQTLCAFVGFEGVRLNTILENTFNLERFIPIVAFPTGAPQWYNITMWNSMDTLQSVDPNVTIHKCLSESIFEAVNLLNEILSDNEKIVLAPLGTRPHSMAAAIYACKHSNARIVYDYVEECEHRANGIAHITIYHLSSFLNT